MRWTNPLPEIPSPGSCGTPQGEEPLSVRVRRGCRIVTTPNSAKCPPPVPQLPPRVGRRPAGLKLPPPGPKLPLPGPKPPLQVPRPPLPGAHTVGIRPVRGVLPRLEELSPLGGVELSGDHHSPKLPPPGPQPPPLGALIKRGARLPLLKLPTPREVARLGVKRVREGPQGNSPLCRVGMGFGFCRSLERRPHLPECCTRSTSRYS